MEATLFTTERLLVRHFSKKDLNVFFDMVGDPEVMRYIKKPLNFEESKKELHQFISYYKSEKRFFHLWAVVEKENNEVVGLCGVYLNDKSEYEIAYRFRKSFWGKGYGGEIAKGLLQYCFEEMKLEELTAYVIKGNTSSVKILEKEMNFVEEFLSKKRKVVERKYHLNKSFK